jgi:hypothetical protein
VLGGSAVGIALPVAVHRSGSGRVAIAAGFALPGRFGQADRLDRADRDAAADRR